MKNFLKKKKKKVCRSHEQCIGITGAHCSVNSALTDKVKKKRFSQKKKKVKT